MGIRSQIRNRNRFTAVPMGHGAKGFTLICLASFGVHLVFFLSLFWFHDFDFLKPKPRVVRVDLVSFTPGPVGGPVKTPAVEKTSESKKDAVNLNATPAEATPPQPKTPRVLKPDLSLKTKPKNIKDLMADRDKKPKPKVKPEPRPEKKAPEPDPEKELAKAREALEKRVEEQKQAQIDEAMRRMQEAIAAKEMENPEGQGEGPGTGTGPGAKVSDAIKLYQMNISSTIHQNWVFSDVMARMDKNLECIVLVKILKNGDVRDIIYETKSGNQYLDESVKKAILRSSPLPALPLGMESYDIGFVFTPKGLKGK